MLREELEAGIGPLAFQFVRDFEETPNNPKLVEKVEKMLRRIVEKEPQRFLTPEFIIENEHFLEELPKVVDQLDKRIAEAFGGRSGERAGGRRGRISRIQRAIFGGLSVFMLASLGLICTSETL
ncbi:uncharacterized protein NEMAJ01_1016 [Nematocida major]|uniref:uncharacterized protein n=1 Tax=Nematocida major TaxID=1912982 RepID=UPI002007D6A8|nr:uncharacterized protein NEMAJ01_1016 [Nematocida major]KAH9386120.1 hypothetical protein NEMAJ01_1016 [Nematocida major]